MWRPWQRHITMWSKMRRTQQDAWGRGIERAKSRTYKVRLHLFFKLFYWCHSSISLHARSGSNCSPSPTTTQHWCVCVCVFFFLQIMFYRTAIQSLQIQQEGGENLLGHTKQCAYHKPLARSKCETKGFTNYGHHPLSVLNCWWSSRKTTPNCCRYCRQQDNATRCNNGRGETTRSGDGTSPISNIRCEFLNKYYIVRLTNYTKLLQMHLTRGLPLRCVECLFLTWQGG